MSISIGRGGNGMNGDGTWPETDGRGCPVCGAFVLGGAMGEHGGGCPNSRLRYNRFGHVVGRNHPANPKAAAPGSESLPEPAPDTDGMA